MVTNWICRDSISCMMPVLTVGALIAALGTMPTGGALIAALETGSAAAALYCARSFSSPGLSSFRNDTSWTLQASVRCGLGLYKKIADAVLRSGPSSYGLR